MYILCLHDSVFVTVEEASDLELMHHEIEVYVVLEWFLGPGPGGHFMSLPMSLHPVCYLSVLQAEPDIQEVLCQSYIVAAMLT